MINDVNDDKWLSFWWHQAPKLTFIIITATKILNYDDDIYVDNYGDAMEGLWLEASWF